MTKKELIISLMKLDNFYNEKIDELDAVLGSNSCIECFYPDKNIKSIEEIVLDYIGIPKDNYNEETEKGYCRDFAGDIYFNAVSPKWKKYSFGKAYEILVSMANNKGDLIPKYERYLCYE